MKTRISLYALRFTFHEILVWLAMFVIASGLACQPQARIKADKAPVITETRAEITVEASVVTEAPAAEATTTETLAAPKAPPITEPPDEITSIEAVTEQLPDETTTDAIVATVNGVDITESQIEAKMEPQLKRIAAQAAQLPPSVIEPYKKQLRQQALESIIIERLLDEKVKAKNIVVTEENAMEQLQEMASQQKISLEDFKALIEASGQNFDQVKQRVWKGLGYQKLMEAQFAGKVNITEDDAQKYYSEHKSEFETPEQVRASHILIQPDTTDPAADPNEAKAKAQAKAKDLLKQIKAGADFATLAIANSSCPSGAQGGDLNFFNRGQMIPAFEEAAFKLEIGQVSSIVETRFGYHIIKVTDRKDTGVITFEQAKDDIISGLTQQKQNELATEYIESLKAEANITYPAGKEPNSVPRSQ